MARTTVDIDDPILRDLKKLHKERNLPLGKLISELLTKAPVKHEAGTISREISHDGQCFV